MWFLLSFGISKSSLNLTTLDGTPIKSGDVVNTPFLINPNGKTFKVLSENQNTEINKEAVFTQPQKYIFEEGDEQIEITIKKFVAATKTTLGIFNNRTSALLALSNFLKNRYTSSGTLTDERVVLFVPDNSVNTGNLNKLLTTKFSPDSFALVGPPNKDLIQGLALPAITLMTDDIYGLQYSKIPNVGKVELYSTGENPYADLKTYSKETEWDQLLNEFQSVSISDPYVTPSAYEHVFIYLAGGSNVHYYIPHPKALISKCDAYVSDKINSLITSQKIIDLDVHSIATFFKSSTDPQIRMLMQGLTGLYEQVVSGFYGSLDQKPFLFVIGAYPFDKVYGFEAFGEIMTEYVMKYNTTYSVVYVPVQMSFPLEMLPTAQSLKAVGLKTYDPLLDTPIEALYLLYPDAKWGGYWNNIFYTIKPENVVSFAGNVIETSDEKVLLLGDMFNNVESITPPIPVITTNFWVPWKIGALGGSMALLLIIIFIWMGITVHKERTSAEKKYYLTNAPTVGNSVGSLAV